MRAHKSLTAAGTLAAASAIALILGGCSYDYFQRTDRVSHSAGDAVKANLERETVNPSPKSSNSTGGLGKNGEVSPTPIPPGD